VRETSEGWRVLLLRAYKYWDCPKGMVEPGEEPLATAIREVREETGLHDLEFRWGEAFIETEPYARNKVARYYVAASREDEVTLPVNPVLGRPEHQEALWLTFDAALARVGQRVANVLRWAEARVTSP